MIKPLILISVALLISCGGKSDKQGGSMANAPVDRKEKLRFNQYKVKGMDLYNKHCVACHQPTGEGLQSLYPPLKASDYLLNDLPRAACIIKYGQTQEIVVNGKTYNQMMPGVPTLTPLEVAEVLTYITNEWGNEEGLIDVKTVEKWLEKCEE